MAKSDGSVRINTLVDTQGFGKGMNTMQKQIGGLSGAIGKLGLAITAAFGIGKLIQFGKEAIELGSDLQEVQNVVDVTFRTMSDQVNEFARNAAEAAGLSETMAKRYMGTFGAMASSFGFMEEEAFSMSASLTQAVGDVASFYNITQDEAYTKLKSVFTGETESLKDLGVVMTQSALDAYAMANGYEKTTSAMSEQEKVALRYSFVLDQLSASSGDFVRTSDSWANQMRILNLSLDTFKANIGQALINVFTPFLKIINQLVARMADLSASFVTFSQLITGRGSSGGGSPGAVLDGIADGYDDVASATDKAAKAQKNYSHGFDELSVMSKDAGASGGSANFLDMESLAGSFNEEINKTEESINRIRELLKENYEEGFQSDKTFSDLRENIEDTKTAIAEMFNSPEVKDSMDEFKTTLVEAQVSMAGSAVSVGTSIGYGVTGGIKDAFEDPEFKEFAETKLVSIFSNMTNTQKNAKNLASAFAKMATAFEGEGFQNIIEFFTKLQAASQLGIVDFVTGLVSDLSDLVSSPFIENSEEWTTLLENIFDLISNLIGPAEELLDIFLKDSSTYEDSWLHSFFQNLTDNAVAGNKEVLDSWNGLLEALISETEDFSLSDIQEWFISGEDVQNWWNTTISPWFTKEKWSELLYSAGESFGEWWTGVVQWWDEELPAWWEESVTPWLSKEKWLEELDNIGEATADAWDDSFGKWGEDISNWFEEDVEPWLSKEKWQELGESMKDGLYNGFKAIVTSITDLLNEIITGAENGINGLISGINSFIEGYNSAVPSELSINTLETVSFEKIPYPKLATGAVIPPNAPFMAMLGDQRHGTNLEAPEDLIRQIVREEAGGNAEMMALLSEIAKNTRDTADKEMIIGDRDIAKANARGQRSMGYALIEG